MVKSVNINISGGLSNFLTEFLRLLLSYEMKLLDDTCKRCPRWVTECRLNDAHFKLSAGTPTLSCPYYI